MAWASPPPGQVDCFESVGRLAEHGQRAHVHFHDAHPGARVSWPAFGVIALLLEVFSHPELRFVVAKVVQGFQLRKDPGSQWVLVQLGQQFHTVRVSLIAGFGAHEQGQQRIGYAYLVGGAGQVLGLATVQQAVKLAGQARTPDAVEFHRPAQCQGPEQFAFTVIEPMGQRNVQGLHRRPGIERVYPQGPGTVVLQQMAVFAPAVHQLEHQRAVAPGQVAQGCRGVGGDPPFQFLLDESVRFHAAHALDALVRQPARTVQGEQVPRKILHVFADHEKLDLAHRGQLGEQGAGLLVDQFRPPEHHH